MDSCELLIVLHLALIQIKIVLIGVIGPRFEKLRRSSLNDYHIGKCREMTMQLLIQRRTRRKMINGNNSCK